MYDISDTLQTKIDAIKCYATQFPPEKEYIYDRVSTMAVACGLSAGLEAGEVLTATHALGSRDLLNTLLLT